MENLLTIEPVLLNPGASNADYPHCLGLTFFRGKLIMAYGSCNQVIVATSTLSIIASLDDHSPKSTVTAVSWAPYSGRLASAADDNKIIIYEPISEKQSGSLGWHYLKSIDFSGQYITCLSWSLWDYTFCTCNNDFTIYHTNSNQFIPGLKDAKEVMHMKEVARFHTKTIFCSHSRDSRLILTIPYQSKEVIIYHRREKTTNEYCQIHLSHPSIVKSARWRTSDQIHERCFFMTIAEDHILRIWSETCVNEQLMFSVVAAIPAKYHITAANFISTASRLVQNNPIVLKSATHTYVHHDDNILINMIGNTNKVRSDVYVNGHGHDQIYDRDVRETNIASQKELDRNHFYILTVNNEQEIVIWEILGISSNVRTTPKIVGYSHPVLLGSTSVNQLYAYCRLESEFTHINDSNFVGKPSSMLMVIQNNETKVITSLDVSIFKRTLQSTRTRMRREYLMSIHGHQSTIRSIRVHPTTSFMASLDHNENVLLWRYNDTDVYDPCHLITFYCQLNIKLKEIAWFPKKDKLLASNGEKFMIINVPVITDDPIVEVEPVYLDYIQPQDTTYIINDVDFLPPEEAKEQYEKEVKKRKVDPTKNLKAHHLISVNIALQLMDQSYILYAASEKIINVMRLQNSQLQCLKRIKRKSSNKGKEHNFVDCASVYISRILPLTGASICFFATKHAVFCTILAESTITPQNANKSIEVEKCIEIKDHEIISLCVAHPAYLFIACETVIYVCIRISSSYHQFKILHTINIEGYVPLKMRCIPSGIFSVMSKDGIHLYYPVRESYSYLNSNLNWKPFASVQTPKSCAHSDLEWTLDGILVYSMGRQLYSLTKYMHTFFLKSDINKKLPTIHQTLSKYSRMIPDIHPSILIPIAISGRQNLTLNLLNFLNENYNNKESHFIYSNLILHQSREKSENAPFKGDINKLLSELTEKLTDQPLPEFNEEDNKILLEFIKKLPAMMAITTDSVDKIALPVARAITLTSEHMIPFDLVQLAYMSQEQLNILDMIDFSIWESIENSGVFYWIKDIQSLSDRLVKFAIASFHDNQHLSILVLVILQKFIILKSLFTKSGDNPRGQFFSRDFTQKKNQNSAEKNAYSALKKHDYHIAAALFFLADKLSIAIHIVMENIQDASLAYFFARCYDLKNENVINPDVKKEDATNPVNSFATFLTEKAIPYATKKLDFAAVDYFNRKLDPELSYNVDDRYQSELAGNVADSSQFFGDMRFVTCELLRTTIEQKSYLSLCFLLSGHYLLSALFMKYFDLTTNHKKKEDSTNNKGLPMKISSSIGNLKAESKNKISMDDLMAKQVEDDDLTSDDNDDQDNDIDSVNEFSFGYCGTGFDDLSIDYSSESSSADDDESSTSKIRNNQSDRFRNTPLLRNSPSITAYLHQSGLMNQTKSRFYTGLYSREYSLNFPQKLSKLIENNLNGTGIKFLDWFIMVIGFNIARNRLESFIESQYDFEVLDLLVDQIIPEVQSTEKQLNLKNNQLLNYLIRSCKRRGFVFRRLLLIADDDDKRQYVMEICSSLSKLPDQMMGSSLTSQQVSQIAMTLKCVIRFINQVKPFTNPKQDELYFFVYISIMSALYIVAVFYHNVDLMTKILSFKFPDLTPFQESLLVEFVAFDEKNISKKEIGRDTNYFSFMKSSILKRFIICPSNCNPSIFETFVAAQVDFMFIDSFYRRLAPLWNDEMKRLKLKKYSKYIQMIIMSIKKLRDSQAQYFTYATLNMKHFSNFNLLHGIRSDDENDQQLNELIKQQLNAYGRKKLVKLYCKSIISRYSYSIKDREKKKNMRSGFILKHMKFTENIHLDVIDVCFTYDGSTLLVLTRNGIKSYSMTTIDTDESSVSYSKSKAKPTESSNSLLVDESGKIDIPSKKTTKRNEKDDDDEEEEEEEENNNHEIVDSSEGSDKSFDESTDNEDSDTNSFCDQYSEITRPSTPNTTVSTIPTSPSTENNNQVASLYSTRFQSLIKRHPNKNMVLLAKDGGVSIMSFDNKNNKLSSETYNFQSNKQSACTGVAFSSDGTMFAASRESQVDLYSFFVKENNSNSGSKSGGIDDELQSIKKTPFTVIQTYSSQVLGVGFIKGTGVVVTLQTPSSQCYANIAFWDVFMQNTMIASLSLNENEGIVTSMAYSSLYSLLFVGTTKGTVFTIDIKTFQIINRFRIYSLHSHKSKKKDKKEKDKKEKEKDKDKDKKEKKHKEKKDKEKKLTKKEIKEKVCGVSAMFIDDDQTFLATGSTNGKLKIWDILTSKLLQHEKVFGDKNKKVEVTSIDFYNNIFCVSGGQQIKLFNYTLPQHMHSHKHKHEKK